MVGRGRAAVVGVTAAAVALGAGELIAVLTDPSSGPVVAVGGWIIDHVPESGKELAITLFGTYDKVALQVGTVIILGAIAAVLGIAARRSIVIGFGGVAAFGVIGAAAAVSRPNATGVWVIPSLVGAALAMLVLHRALATIAAAPQPQDRRRFLWITGVGLAAAGLAGGLGRVLTQRPGVTEVARKAVDLPAPVSPAGSLPDNVLPGYVTPNDTFYRVDTALVVPKLDPKQWRLRVHGMVEQEFSISYAELLAMPMIERYVTLSCVSNDIGGKLVGNARWLGVPVKDVLDRAKPRKGADQVVSRSSDGWTCGTPTAALMDGRDALLAIAMNGEPLPLEHGFPVRMVVPGLYGYVSACKWVVEWEVTTFAAFDAYWIPRGWAQQAPIKTMSRIDTPDGRKKQQPGEIMIAGVAWAQQRGIDKVEVKIDNEPWREAELLGVASIDTWRQWRLRWQATPGEHTLVVRATDRGGKLQIEKVEHLADDGATGWHTVKLSVV